MIALHKGSNAEMQALLQQVWPLEEERNQLELAMLALTHELNQVRTEYDPLYAKYCSGVPKGQKCIVAHEAFMQLDPLYHRIEQMRQTLRGHLNRHEALNKTTKVIRKSQ
jgi:hypothetical protein